MKRRYENERYHNSGRQRNTQQVQDGSLKQGYNGDLTAREVGSVGGQMVKKMIDAYKTTGNK